MISGVVSQGRSLPRGTLALSAAYFDLETIASPIVGGAGNQIVAPGGLYNALDTVFAPRTSRGLVVAFKPSDDTIFAPRFRQSQILQPLLYVAVDVFPLPAVALPGILQTHLYAVDDAIFVPFISTHGSLRPGLFNAFDAIYAPRVVSAQTLLPNLYTASDVFYAPIARVGIRPSLISDADVHYTSSAAGTVVLATFDGIATEVSLSLGNLKATHTTTSTATAGARSTQNKTTGKFYFEVTINVTHGLGDTMGLIASGATYPDILNLSENCTVFEIGSGNIFSNDGFADTFGSGTSAGTVIGVAVDLTARLAWFRKGAGNWNNDAAQNPATGAGGVTVEATLAFAPVLAFGGPGAAINDAMTANFGQSAFANAAPVGFGNWSA